MAAEDTLLSLSAPELRIIAELRLLGEGRTALELDLSTKLGLPIESVRGSLERLRAKKLVLLRESHEKRLSLTDRGREALKVGLPEQRLLRLLSNGSLTQAEAMERGGFDGREFSVAVGQLRRIGGIRLGERLEAMPTSGGDLLAEEKVLHLVGNGVLPGSGDGEVVGRLLKRGLVVSDTRATRAWSISSEGSLIDVSQDTSEYLGALTSEHLRSRAWQGAHFRPYDVRASVPYIGGARTQIYLSWLREFEEILIGLGFEEWSGPVAETDFYNNDALFIPQSHPARTMQDVFLLKDVEGEYPPEDLLRRVGNAHEGRPIADGEEPLSTGWGERYQRELSRRTLLRSQTTSVSVRYLITHPNPPFRMYSIGPAFRREAVDATHHVQFDQCEGVYGGKGVNMRNLLGLFTEIAKAIGIRDVKFKPTYFPFTEPSVEGYVKHPSLGWIEVLPGGLLRPEVLKPLGIDVPVAAWGIGVMRLAMVALGIGDIREIYANPVSRLSERRV